MTGISTQYYGRIQWRLKQNYVGRGTKPEPLFSRLDLADILKSESRLVDSKDNETSIKPIEKGGNIDFEDFMKVEMRTGR